ncbi:MAG TPA: acetyltransferase [Pirellulales bacterium]|jgi:sugar O-acyltransferase (sialic acid O-acetyltransferase NeuD family)|nr:acetyltransferase [Pirellulales bacterium]
MRLGLELIVVGAGGHAKVVISSLRASGWEVRAVYDDDRKKWNRKIMGINIEGPIEKLSEPDHFPAVIAVGDPLFRQYLAERYDRDWVTVLHPRAYVDATATVGPGSVVFAGAIIQPDVVIGAHAIINTSASIDHDCAIADYAHMAPGAHLAANVHVQRGAFLGTGAHVIPGITIGEYTIVGAGSTVVRDIPGHVTAVGCPAKVIKTNPLRTFPKS